MINKYNWPIAIDDMDTRCNRRRGGGRGYLVVYLSSRFKIVRNRRHRRDCTVRKSKRNVIRSLEEMNSFAALLERRALAAMSVTIKTSHGDLKAELFCAQVCFSFVTSSFVTACSEALVRKSFFRITLKEGLWF